MKESINLTLVKGVEGLSISLNSRRICGPKPWGGGPVIKEWEIPLSEILKALNLELNDPSSKH